MFASSKSEFPRGRHRASTDRRRPSAARSRAVLGGVALSSVTALGVSLSGTSSAIAEPTHPNADVPTGTDHSTMNWGGYIANGTDFKTVSASWRNPKVDCSVRNIASFWVGFDGWRGSKTVEQIGLDANCRNGKLVYRTWYQLYPDPSVYLDDLVSEAGDEMNAQVTKIGDDMYALNIEDVTRKWSKQVPVKLDREVQQSSVEVVVEPIGKSDDLAPLPNFSSVTFTKATVDGRNMDELSPTPEKANLARNDQQLAETGPIKNGEFTVTWQHS